MAGYKSTFTVAGKPGRVFGVILVQSIVFFVSIVRHHFLLSIEQGAVFFVLPCLNADGTNSMRISIPHCTTKCAVWQSQLVAMEQHNNNGRARLPNNRATKD
jgi:hypothetical protein